MTFFSFYLGKRQKPRGKFGKTFFYFYFWRTPDFSRKFRVFSREDLFFLRSPGKIFYGPFFLRALPLCVLGPWPWPRLFLSLASRGSVLEKSVLDLGFFCVLGLGLEGCVLDSTSGMSNKSAVSLFWTGTAEIKIINNSNSSPCKCGKMFFAVASLQHFLLQEEQFPPTTKRKKTKKDGWAWKTNCETFC